MRSSENGGPSTPHPVYSLAQRRRAVLHGLEGLRSRHRTEYQPDTRQEEGKGALLANVYRRVPDAHGAVLCGLGSRYEGETGDGPPPLTETDALAAYLDTTFDLYDGALLLGERGFGDQHVMFKLRGSDAWAFDLKEHRGGRHRAAASAAQHPLLETFVLSATDGAIRYFNGDNHREWRLDEPVAPSTSQEQQGVDSVLEELGFDDDGLAAALTT